MFDLLILMNRISRLRNVQICVMLSWKVVVLLILTNSVFKLQNVQIWNVSNCKGVYLLIFRNGIFKSRNVVIFAVTSRKRVDLLTFTYRVFRVRNVEICVLLSSNEVDLLMLRNRVFRLRFVRYGQCSHERTSFCWYSRIVFWGLESFIYCFSAILCGKFAYSQKSRFLALKRSYTGSAALEGGRSAFINEFCFQGGKLSDVDYVEVQGVLFADWDFETVVLSWKVVVLQIFTNSVFKLKTFRNGLWRNARGLFAERQEWHFQAAKRSDISSTILQEGRFAHAQE